MVDLLKKKQKMRRVKSLEKAEKKKKICIERGTAHCRSRFLIKPKILFTFLFLFTRRVCMYKKLFVCIHVMSLSLVPLLPPYFAPAPLSLCARNVLLCGLSGE